ncbi:MAG: hypothetical protein GF383_01030, partial [Candidatus Lokiarchaeota archaeon]|nr:hypothetical protein [Candidatus Lokiarchaeota archaeon]MBD3337824.1 hypothetical protein [Candidatus Lokiarchaeota archaeon]
MDYTKKKVKDFAVVISFTALFIVLSLHTYNFQLTNLNSQNSSDDNLSKDTSVSDSWDEKDIPFIHIDANWTQTNSTYNWCNGKGTLMDPYIIENITINGNKRGFCILINNSQNIYFIIRNVTCYNSTASTNSGSILLENTNNGTLIWINCSYNDNIGLYLKSSHNNLVRNNFVNNNELIGLKIEDCENNTIQHNTIKNNTLSGLVILNSNINTIGNNEIGNNDGSGVIINKSADNIFKNNNVVDNKLNGISLNWSEQLVIEENDLIFNQECGLYIDNTNHTLLFKNSIVNNSQTGLTVSNSLNLTLTENRIENNSLIGLIMLSDTRNNLIYKNYFLKNGLHGIDNGTNNKWNSSKIGNYWDNYTTPIIGGKDENKDGIGDVNYTLPGIKLSNDTKPIYGDPFHDGKPIVIDGRLDSTNKSWAWISTRAWGSGSGSLEDPYVLNDVSIDGGLKEACITVSNTTDYFTIKNCFVSYSGNGTNIAGILISNSSFGEITNNTCFLNNATGIYLSNVLNFTISSNTVNNNTDYGIFLNSCQNSSIYGNLILYNLVYGLFLNTSNNNTISNNNFFYNSLTGIASNEPSESNLIYLNNFTGNLLNAMDNGTFNMWDNGSIGNYWDDYTGADRNNDGIGDTPYKILGTAGSYDHYPIWEDNLNRISSIIIGDSDDEDENITILEFFEENLTTIAVIVILVEVFIGVAILFNKRRNK